MLVFVGPPGGGIYLFSHFAVVHKVSEVLITYLNFLSQIWLRLLTRMPESCAVVFFSSLVYMFTNTTLNRLGFRMLIVGTAIFIGSEFD